MTLSLSRVVRRQHLVAERSDALRADRRLAWPSTRRVGGRGRVWHGTDVAIDVRLTRPHQLAARGIGVFELVGDAFEVEVGAQLGVTAPGLAPSFVLPAMLVLVLLGLGVAVGPVSPVAPVVCTRGKLL